MNNPPSYSETTGQPGPAGPTEVVHVVQQNLLVLGNSHDTGPHIFTENPPNDREKSTN